MIPVTKVREHGQPVGIRVPFLNGAGSPLTFGEREYLKSNYNPLNKVYDPYFEKQQGGAEVYTTPPSSVGAKAIFSLEEGREGRLCFVATPDTVAAPLGLFAVGDRIGGSSGAFYEGGKEYVLSFYAKVNNLGALNSNPIMDWPYTTPANVKAAVRPPISLEWQRYFFFIRFSSSTTGVFRITTGGGAPVGTKLYIADISIEEGRDETPLYGDFYERVK